MPTKTPTTKSKKPAAKAGATAKAPAAKEAKAAGKPDAKDDPKKKRGPKAIAKPGAAREDGDGDGDGDDEDDDEDEFIPKKGAAKPAVEPTAVVPARRLTPEAKAAINAMVQKGVPLDEALRRAGSWETFIAPVKDDTQKAFPGKDGAGPRSPFGGRRPSGPRGDKADKNDAPNGGFNFEDEDPGPSLGDDEPIVAGGDDD